MINRFFEFAERYGFPIFIAVLLAVAIYTALLPQETTDALKNAVRR